MRKPLLIGAAALAASVLITLILLSGMAGQSQKKVCFRSECFTVELALTPEQQARGLMFRESLPPGSGMLFVFQEEGVYPFWMKNTLIPLDMAWIDSGGTVVFIKENAQPCGLGDCPLINPGKPARYVLEVNAGAAGRIVLEEGERAEISGL